MPSRPLKFRVFIKSSKRMYAVHCLYVDGSVEIIDEEGNRVSLDPSEMEMMQFTVLKDKNGVEIYEGDIVSHSCQDYGAGQRLQQVIFQIGKNFTGFVPKELHSEYFSHFMSWQGCEVIGNIYKNPELLHSGG